MKIGIIKTIFTVILFSGSAALFAQPKGKQEGQKPPTAEQLIKELDANKDGKLSKDEIKGPIKDDFTKIDTNKDGFLSLQELKKAPKPERKKPTE
jgi:Ca2+-binding EF-hand superfamily protein